MFKKQAVEDGGIPLDTRQETSKLLEPAVEDLETTKGGASFFSAWFNATNITLGAGTLSIPFAISCSGMFLGVAMVLMMGFLANTSIRALLWSEGLSAQSAYQEVARKALGTKGAIFVDVVIICDTLFTIVAYEILFGDLVPDVLVIWTGEAVFGDRTLVMGLMTAAIVYPLSLLPRIDYLRHSSLVSIMCITYLVAVVIVHAALNNFNDVEDGYLGEGPVPEEKFDVIPVTFTWRFFYALPIVGFAYTSHIQIYQIYSELQHKTFGSMMNVIHSTIVTCTVFYMTIGIVGYSTFRGVIDGNVFNNLQNEELLTVSLGKFLLALSLCFSTPLFVFPCREHVIHLFYKYVDAWKGQAHTERGTSWLLHVLVTTVIVGFCYFIGVFVPDVEDVFALCGSTTGTLVMFVLPGLFYIRLSHADTSYAARTRRYYCYFLIAFGVFMGVTGTVASVGEFTGLIE